MVLAAALAVAVGAPPAIRAGAPRAVRVQLVFDGRADLDLYVTGPGQESVYFANRTSHDGGALEADRGCEAPAPRTEVIAFDPAPAGPYRVGIDFMLRCDGGVDRAPYELVIEAPGSAPVRRRGEAVFGRFDPRVAEFEVGDAD